MWPNTPSRQYADCTALNHCRDLSHVKRDFAESTIVEWEAVDLCIPWAKSLTHASTGHRHHTTSAYVCTGSDMSQTRFNREHNQNQHTLYLCQRLVRGAAVVCTLCFRLFVVRMLKQRMQFVHQVHVTLGGCGVCAYEQMFAWHIFWIARTHHARSR